MIHETSNGKLDGTFFMTHPSLNNDTGVRVISDTPILNGHGIKHENFHPKETVNFSVLKSEDKGVVNGYAKKSRLYIVDLKRLS